MIRRFVNLVMENGGYGSRVYSLHRRDAAKHLFYPSIADAEAANAKEKNNGGGGGGVDKQKPKPPPRIGRLRRLPPPSLRLPTDEVNRRDTLNDMFTFLSPAAGGGGEGRILHVGETGHGLIYDADARSVVTAPTLDEPKGYNPVVVSIAAGAGEESSERIYVLASQAYEHSFQVLDLSAQSPRKWQPLPLPPPLLGDWSPAEIKSYTVVGGGGGGAAIVASCDGGRTYRFDTASDEWRHAGDWALPFDGRAEHVPELNAWLGFCPKEPDHLCACTDDLSGIVAAMDDGDVPREAAPKLQHLWEVFTPPAMEETAVVLNRRFPRYVLRRSKDWRRISNHLVNLGSGRFCIARVFVVVKKEWVGFEYDALDMDTWFVVLIGVEVLRSGDDGDGKGVLRMVKHKSKRYQCTGDENIGWVL